MLTSTYTVAEFVFWGDWTPRWCPCDYLLTLTFLTLPGDSRQLSAMGLHDQEAALA